MCKNLGFVFILFNFFMRKTWKIVFMLIIFAKQKKKNVMKNLTGIVIQK